MDVGKINFEKLDFGKLDFGKMDFRRRGFWKNRIRKIDYGIVDGYPQDYLR